MKLIVNITSYDTNKSNFSSFGIVTENNKVNINRYYLRTLYESKAFQKPIMHVLTLKLKGH